MKKEIPSQKPLTQKPSPKPIVLNEKDQEIYNAIKQKADIENDPTAQYLLGCAFLKADKLPKDEHLAVHYLKKSAEQGFQKAFDALVIFANELEKEVSLKNSKNKIVKDKEK